MEGNVLRRGSALAAILAAVPGSLLAAQEAGGSSVFSLDIGLVIWTWVLFLLTLGILAWKVFPWIAGSLEERQAKIQDAIDEARRDREEARRILEEHREKLAEARREAREILEEGREAGERLREDILDEAREEQEKLLERARREMERERERLRDEIREEAVEISIAAAERLIRSELGSDENRRLVRDYVAELQ
ncbi:MAG: F0F1 ATP synthase subunit B [Gemmatimonadota bacterium]